MKKQYIFPVILGGTFFAVPYLAMGIGLWPSVATAGIAYGAGWLLTRDKKQESSLDVLPQNQEETLKIAKQMNSELLNIAKKIEDKQLVSNINEIADVSDKILNTLMQKPEKFHQANNFLNYYLPVTIKILKRYDEIENQKLETEQTKKFMSSIQEMVEKIKIAFITQLSNMYQTDMIDTDAEIKVFESMLKADGFLEENDFKKKS